MSLFQRGSFTAHSGNTLPYKIECDYLTENDLRCLAGIVANRLRFKEVHGIPTGGERFARILQEFVTSDSNNTLIVDDVLTTGKSMMEKWKELRYGNHKMHIYGVVIFCRHPSPPEWIKPIFQLDPVWIRP